MAIEIVDLPIKNGDFPVRYVKLPEGNTHSFMIFYDLTTFKLTLNGNFQVRKLFVYQRVLISLVYGRYRMVPPSYKLVYKPH